jgi:uncharacterized protein YbaP (TraB family)
VTRRSRLVAALLALAVAFGVAVSAAAKPPIWVVRSPSGGTAVLFGSIHLLPPGLDWRPAALDAAVASAGEIWFELPINADSDNRANVASARRGSLPADRRLMALLTPEQAEKLRRAALMLDCAPDALDRMQPWMAELTLSVADDARSGGTAFNGVEAQMQAITPTTVRRQAFETAEQQIGFLAGAAVKDQLASLAWTLHEIEDDPASYRRVVDEWVAGDLEGLQRDAIEPLQQVSPALYQRLLAERNKRWARQIKARLRRPGQIVVVVGVGHMIGADGLPALLRAQGLRVEGP